jgi:hypothetical protein
MTFDDIKGQKREGRVTIMKRGIIFLMASLLVSALGGVSRAWQGRMGGMDEPYGLMKEII